MSQKKARKKKQVGKGKLKATQPNSDYSNYPIPLRATDIQKKKNSIVLFFKRFWKLTASLGILIGLIVGINELIQLSKSKKDKYEEENFVEGTLEAPKIESGSADFSILEYPPIFTNAVLDTLKASDSIISLPKINGLLIKNMNESEKILFSIGIDNIAQGKLINIPISTLKKGISLNISSFLECSDKKILMCIKDSRLYISVDFKDLQKEEIIGFIEFNHWKLFKPNLLDFKSDDSRLQVRDRQGNIVFTINYALNTGNLNTLSIGGYFIGDESVSILTNLGTKYIIASDTCIRKSDSLWKQKASKIIKRVQPVF
jgi:hypothetical protein